MRHTPHGSLPNLLLGPKAFEWLNKFAKETGRFSRKAGTPSPATSGGP